MLFRGTRADVVALQAESYVELQQGTQAADGLDSFAIIAQLLT